MTDPHLLLVDAPVAAVRCLTLHRPDRHNALSTALLAAVADALAEVDRDDAVHVAVIAGSDTVFAAGADLHEIDGLGADDPVDSPRFRAWQTIRGFSKPLVAAVEGWCVGAGIELAMCCDLIVAGDGARFGQPETNLGIIPGGGGTAALTRLVGRALAMRMILTGEPIDAARALDAGLIAEIVPAGTARAAALALAGTLAARAPLALRAAKASVRDAAELPLSEHVVAERRRFVGLLGTADKAEGIAAFREKRPPRWTGR